MYRAVYPFTSSNQLLLSCFNSVHENQSCLNSMETQQFLRRWNALSHAENSNLDGGKAARKFQAILGSVSSEAFLSLANPTHPDIGLIRTLDFKQKSPAVIWYICLEMWPDSQMI